MKRALEDAAKTSRDKRIQKAEIEALERDRDFVIASEREKMTLRASLKRQMQNQRNIEEISSMADTLLSEEKALENSDKDWRSNLFQKCGTVSDKRVQELWAKILAGEANQQGSFSKKTVNLLADFDNEAANLFTKLCGFCWTIDGETTLVIFDWDEEIYTKNGIHLESLLYLENLGVVKILRDLTSRMITVGGSGRRIEKKKALYFGKSINLENHIPNKHFANVGDVSLTKSGLELSKICEPTEVKGFYEYSTKEWSKYNESMVSDAPQDSENLQKKPDLDVSTLPILGEENKDQ